MDRVDTPPDIADNDALKHLSKVLFGGAGYRIRIAVAISNRGGVANTAELADDLGISRQSVNQELLVLERVGLLRRAERRERKVFWTAEPSGYWEFCREVAVNADAMARRAAPF